MKFTFLLVAWFTGAACLAQSPLDTAEDMSIGGMRQHITIQSKDPSLPLLLFLHGGPGGSMMDYAGRFSDKLQEHFVVIHWDQRETGRTRQLNPSSVPLSLAVFQNDTRELIDSLLKRFQRRKIYLAGHSWGTALGFHVARHCADLLYAYIPIGPMVNQLESERIALHRMKEKALKTGNEKAFAELSRVHIPFEDGDQLYFHRKWLLDYSGSRKKLSKEYVDTWASRWLAVFNEASKVNLVESLPAIECPVYFFVGRNDFQTNSSLAENYYAQLTAPKKDLFWFEYSGHSIPTREPERMQALLIERVLPETFIIQKPGGGHRAIARALIGG